VCVHTLALGSSSTAAGAAAFLTPLGAALAAAADALAYGHGNVRTQERACVGGTTTNSVDRQNQTHAATHNIWGLCVPRRRCPVVPLSLHLKRESELQAPSCVTTATNQFHGSKGTSGTVCVKWRIL